ncbi:hypothetical protein [Streptomyces ossamyceticus]|nr:hypothetical protein [Streptomyces ossamyceticus]
MPTRSLLMARLSVATLGALTATAASVAITAVLFCACPRASTAPPTP